MALTFPIRLDSEILLQEPQGNTSNVRVLENGHLQKDYVFTNLKGLPTIVSGYDSSQENQGRGLRVTNLSYIRKGELFKHCPACEGDFPFDSYSTRTTNERRDQSDCEKCRKLAS